MLTFEKGAAAAVTKDLEDHQHNQPVVLWKMGRLVRKPFCFRLTSPTDAFLPEKAIDGYNRPFAGPHQWSSEAVTDGKPRMAGIKLGCADSNSVRSYHME